MNQILVTDRLYVTNKLRKKKKMYRVQFIISVIFVLIFSGWYVWSEVQKNASEAVSKDILEDMSTDVTTSTDKPLVVALDDTEVVDDSANENAQPVEQNGKYTDSNGNTYEYEAILTIPSIGIEYPVLSQTSEELLKISVNKFWGGSPNSVGNYCIVGHNYKSGKMFGKLSQMKSGDIVKLKDMSGKTVDYKVYDRYVVDPNDVACTSQITNGKREITLITCTNGGKQRLILKCREVE